MRFQNLFAIVVCASAAVTQGQEFVPVSPDTEELPFTIFETSDDTSAVSLFGMTKVHDRETLRPAFEPTGDAGLVRLSHYRELEDRVASLQSEIQQLQYSTSARVANSYDAQPAGNECGCAGLCRCETHPVFFAAAEVPFLRARISGASPVFNVSPGARRLVDPNYDPSVRYVAELRPERSMGLRGRYFRYDHTSAFDPPFQPAELGIELETADLEFVFHHEFRRWNFDVSAGVEYARMQYSADVATAVIGAGTARFEGIGPVFGLSAEHKLGTSQLSFFGSVRASFLMGTLKNQALLINMPQAEIKDEMAQVYQNQLGIVWNPELFDRCGIAVRAGWETQFWLNDTYSDDSYGIGSNLSVTGPMVSAELTY